MYLQKQTEKNRRVNFLYYDEGNSPVDFFCHTLKLIKETHLFYFIIIRNSPFPFFAGVEYLIQLIDLILEFFLFRAQGFAYSDILINLFLQCSLFLV